MLDLTFSVRYNPQTAQWEVLDPYIGATMYFVAATGAARYIAGKTGGLYESSLPPVTWVFTSGPHTGDALSNERSELHPPARQG
jgi:hypothetical protein